MQGRVGAPPLTHLRGVLAKPETRSAEAGAAIASRRNAAWAAESWDAKGLAVASMNYELQRHLIDKQTMLAPAELIERK
jgi:hypothetical protein